MARWNPAVLSKLELDDQQKRTVRELWRRGPLSRVQLAACLDLSPAAMTKVARGLLALGLVEEADALSGPTRGRPSIPLRVARGGGYSVGATLHRNVLDMALVDYTGGTIATTQEPFDDPDPRVFAKVLGRRIHDMAEHHRLLGSRMLGVGLGVPGPAYSPEGDRWHTVEGLAPWREVALPKVMSDVLALPVWVENDANAAALAEYYLGGLARRNASAVVILLGHGIGAGVIDHGRLIRGEMGNAGEIGCLYPSDRPRPSTIDLLENLRAEGCDITSVADFEERTRGYEGVVRQWVVRAAAQLELAVNGAMAWLDPGEILLSGPLPRRLLEELVAEITRGNLIRPAHRTQATRISVSTLGGNATTSGAALLPINATASIFR